jgi:hypothetical protein
MAAFLDPPDEEDVAARLQFEGHQGVVRVVERSQEPGCLPAQPQAREAVEPAEEAEEEREEEREEKGKKGRIKRLRIWIRSWRRL